jgi:leader peptidase (prepilin peptidase)/N-methyltransferase
MFEFKIELAILAIFGSIIGSFASCIGSRLFNEEVSILSFKNSICMKCKHKLHFIDLIPILSFLSTNGKCRYCKTSLSIYYILSEILLLISFLAIGYKFDGINTLSISICLILGCLMIQSISDIRNMMASDVVSIIITILAIIAGSEMGFEYGTMLIKFATTICASLLLRYFMLLFIKKDALGLGDVKIFAPLCMLFSLGQVPFFIGITGLLGVLYAMTTKNKNGVFPFVPSISIAFFLSIMLDVNILK